MRVFYIFNIKEEFKYLYKNNLFMLYSLLKQIYYLGADDILYGQSIFNQLTDKVPKSDIDMLLFIKHHKEIPYSKRGEVHIINNLYKDEVSRLIVKNSYLKIITDSSSSSFFDYLDEFGDNFFVCDFNIIDYFFLKEKIKLCNY